TSATEVQLEIPRIVTTAGIPAPSKPPTLVTPIPAPIAPVQVVVAPEAVVESTPMPTQDRFTGTADGLDDDGKLAIRYVDQSRKGERVLLTARCLDVQASEGAPLETEYSILLSPVTGIGTKSIQIPDGWGFVKLSSPDSKAHYAAFF
ncbi:MAG: hypothetical protein ACJAZ8_002792, partial [Planctomycetota bacterium]